MRYAKMIIKLVISIVVIFFFTIPFSRFIYNDLVVEVKSVQKTLTESRATGFEIELTGITQQVLEYNKRLAKAKEYKSYRILNYHIPNTINILEYIK